MVKPTLHRCIYYVVEVIIKFVGLALVRLWHKRNNANILAKQGNQNYDIDIE